MDYRLRRKSKSGFSKLVIVLVLILVFSICYLLKLAPVLGTPEIAKLKLPTQTTSKIIWPDYGSGKFEVVGYKNAISSHGEQSARPIASITKTITALVVLNKKPLSADEDGPSIKLTAADQAIYDKAIANGLAVKPIEVGSKISEKQVLEVMMLASAANYAETLAVWAYGSVDNYLVAANKWLSTHGLYQTKVVDTSGLDAGNISTPSDLIKLGKLALNNRALAKIFSTKQVSVAGAGTVYNGNRLLGKLGVNGIKTGFTGDAGACLLFSSSVKLGGRTVQIVGSLLGGHDSPQVASDVGTLIKSVQKNLHLVKVASKNQPIITITNVLGQKIKLATNKDIYIVNWSDDSINVKPEVGDTGFLNIFHDNGKLVINNGGNFSRYPLFELR